MAPLLSTILLVLLLGAAAGIGRRIYRTFKLSFAFPLEEMVFSAGLGLAVIASMTFIIGLLGLLYEEIFRGLFAVLFALALLWNRDLLNPATAAKKIRDFRPQLPSLLLILLGMALLANLGLNLLGALAPPTDGDALSHVLAMPKSYIQVHQIREFPDRIFDSYNPANIEMLFTFAMLVSSDILAQLIHFAFGFLTAMAIYAFCVRFFTSRKMGLLSAAIFYTIPTVVLLSTTAMVDLGYAFFTFLAIYAFIVWSQTRESLWLVNSGLCIGLASGSKKLGLYSIVVLVIMILLEAWWGPRQNLRQVSKNVTLFLGTAVAIASPWLIRSYLGTGNPVYPFFSSILGGKYLTPAFLESLETGPLGVPERPPWWDYFRILWDSALGRYLDPGIDRFYSSKGPAFLALVPCLIFVKGINPALRGLITYAIGFSLFWFFLSPMPRYDLPIYTVLSIVAGYVAIKLAATTTNRSLVIGIAFALLLSLLPGLLRRPAPGVAVTLNLKPKEQYLTEYAHLNYPVLKYANERLPRSAKVLLLWDAWGYYLDRDYAWGHPPSTPWIDYQQFSDASDFARHLTNLGFTHILVNERVRNIERERLGKDELAQFDRKNPALVNLYQWVADLEANSTLKLVYSQNRVHLYEIADSTLGSCKPSC